MARKLPRTWAIGLVCTPAILPFRRLPEIMKSSDHLDPHALQLLQPRAQQMRQQAMQAFQARRSTRLDRKERKAREAAVQRQLWSEAYQQGLTSFAVPPLLVSLFCRALWAVILYYAEQILSEDEGGV